ncbi:glycosyltransferase family 2 protein [Lamprobacter modestohalophilus]|nr:glycosyltransferase [Lamprobacter modestohalophilus]
MPRSESSWHSREDYTRWRCAQPNFSDYQLKKKYQIILLWQAEFGNPEPVVGDCLEEALGYAIAQVCYPGTAPIIDTRCKWLILVDRPTRLAPDILPALEDWLDDNTDAMLCYPDEDQLDPDGNRTAPQLKPDWSPDLFYERHYPGCVIALRADQWPHFASSAQGPNPIFNLFLAYLKRYPDIRPGHVPRVLHHRLRAAEPPESAPAQRQALEKYLQCAYPGAQVLARQGGRLRPRFPLPEKQPLVSVIIPMRDRAQMTRDLVADLQKKTDWNALDILILDNGSKERESQRWLKTVAETPNIRVLALPGPFNFSRINNKGACLAKGDLLLFLNNDLRVIHADWLAEMVRHALRSEVAAVGAKLYYPDNRVQHAGVVLGLGSLAGHVFRLADPSDPGYMQRLVTTCNYSAVTAACMMIRRSVFQRLGGFDEKLAVACNDVDLCLRAVEAGSINVWTPDAELYHLESASRGGDATIGRFIRLQKEFKRMRRRWGHMINQDPMYHPGLSRAFEDYSLRVDSSIDDQTLERLDLCN